MPWELPLADWPGDRLSFRELPVGPSRHLVRFVEVGPVLYAFKEEPLAVAEGEFAVLRHLEDARLPAVVPAGLATDPVNGTAILATEYLAHSLQYRRLLGRFSLGPGRYRDRLLDAMAWLLVDLHRAGVYWGDCSLANTLFRRDGDLIQAFLVDAETSEVHPSLSDGQRAFDVEILVENVAFGLADLAALHDRRDDDDDAIEAAESVRDRYAVLWRELHDTPELPAGDRHAIRSRVRRLNELGFAIDEITVDPLATGGSVRLHLAVSNRDFHARELQRRTGIVALEGQARLLLNDLAEYAAWLAWSGEIDLDEEAAAERWARDVLGPTIGRLAPVIGAERDTIQAYCDVMEHKWFLSERAGVDIGLDAAISGYLERGAPAPEAGPGDATGMTLQIDWSAAIEATTDEDRSATR
ncbi:MAG: DUF4032 domain-containing protein [Chloroflexota bacterium]